MSLTFKGQYTVKKGNYLIYSKNNIQNNGFSLVRNWFVSDKNQLIYEISNILYTNIYTITNR